MIGGVFLPHQSPNCTESLFIFLYNLPSLTMHFRSHEYILEQRTNAIFKLKNLTLGDI